MGPFLFLQVQGVWTNTLGSPNRGSDWDAGATSDGGPERERGMGGEAAHNPTLSATKINRVRFLFQVQGVWTNALGSPNRGSDCASARRAPAHPRAKPHRHLDLFRR